MLVRYAHDIVVLCRSEAGESLRRLGILMEHLHLQMHPEKGQIVDSLEAKPASTF